MPHRRPTVLAGMALALAVAGCGGSGGSGGPQVCTAIGCTDQASVRVDQPGERPLEACVGAVCSPPGEILTIDAARGLQLGDTVEVVVQVAGGGALVARTSVIPTPVRPNGEKCPVECKAVRLRLTVDDQLVPA